MVRRSICPRRSSFERDLTIASAGDRTPWARWGPCPAGIFEWQFVNEEDGMPELRIQLMGIKELREATYLDQQKVGRGINSAINKMSSQLRTEAVRIILEIYTLPAARARQYIRVTQRARGERYEAIVVGRGQGLALSYFNVRQVGVAASRKAIRYTRKAGTLKTGARYGGDISYEVVRGKKEILTTDPKAFLAKMKSGHLGVFHRSGKGRTPIVEEFRVGVGLALGSKKTQDRLDLYVNDKFPAILEHEVLFALNRNK
jgi:hypothetical protein